jgi:ribonucleoside-diphosphate reductase alpha chain
MYVTKRNGEREKVSFDKVLARIEKLAEGLEHVNPTLVTQKVCSQIQDGIHTSELDSFAAETCAMMVGRGHPNYGLLAARIAVDNHQKNTPSTFSECVFRLGLSDKVTNVAAVSYATEIEEMIDYSRDFRFDYFGFKTLEKGYLLRDSRGEIIERPQHMWMRVAIEIHTENEQIEHYGVVEWVPDLPRIKETYDALSLGYFIHATPTLFNAGTDHAQLSSCFLQAMKEDSIRGIYETLGDCAQISKWAGGVGLSIHNIRARNSDIRGTRGKSTGIVPMLKVFNDTAKYVNQGGKRNGSFAVYLEPWHADIEDFLKMKLNTGAEEDRARDLFYALWIPDLFMKRLEGNENWTLMCPNECPGLPDCHGEEFEKLYTSYEQMGKGRKTLPAQKIWQLILDAQIQTGTPYLCYKDAANAKSNQKNLGTIKSSNLCSEIIEYSSQDETAVCNLGSISLPKFVEHAGTSECCYNFEALRKYTRILARNLDNIIDRNYYPTKECHRSNMRNRPIGIGVQGLADVFAMMKMSWTSKDAEEMNRRIFMHIYYAAIEESCSLALERGAYESFTGSPADYGLLQPHLWRVNPDHELDWSALRGDVMRNGLRNSLSIALMPTASTSQILGNNECFEPFTSNLYVRHVLAGDFIIINKYLVEDLVKIGLWNADIRNRIIADNGSVQGIPGLPSDIRERYKTAWEIPMKTIINMSADRAPYVCQSQSLNLFVADPTYARISSMHVYAWKKGLKTGCYYLRTKAVASAQKFTIEPSAVPSSEPECLMCSA